LQGGPGAETFNCGAGQDTVNDFNAGEGDVVLPNCEVVFLLPSYGLKALGSDQSSRALFLCPRTT
jgi:hypothetical protein